MVLQVMIAHTGQRLQLDAVQFASLEEFKSTVARSSGIPITWTTFLAPEGKPVKFQTLRGEAVIFVFDNRLSQSPSSSASSPKIDLPLPKRLRILEAPDTIVDAKSIRAWQDLFGKRRDWASHVVEECAKMADKARDRCKELDAMMRCRDAAVANMQAVTGGLKPDWNKFKQWFPGAEAEHSELTQGWERYLALARAVPVSPTMVRFMTDQQSIATNAKGRPRPTTLEDLINMDQARKAGRLAPAALRKFSGRIVDLRQEGDRFFNDADAVGREWKKVTQRSVLSHENDVLQLLSDVEVLARKTEKDYQTIHDMDSFNVSQVSRIAQAHTEHHLPSLRKRAADMEEMLLCAWMERNSFARGSLEFMRSILSLNSSATSVKSRMTTIDRDGDFATFDCLRLVQQVPYMYATFVAEAIRRREWVNKVKQDSSVLANEMALFQDEEVRRRRRWFKAVGEAYAPEMLTADDKVPGMEINVRGEEEQWPCMTRKDLEDFHLLLQREKADSKVVADVGKLLGELSNPTKQQSKRLKTFKNGSLHEAALGRTGLLMRGDDDLIRSLQDDKSKIENKLKTAESRVRRLEDLLHRQGQNLRSNLSSLQVSPAMSERNDSTISVQSPRIPDDRRTWMDVRNGVFQQQQQMIKRLQDELNAERERSAGLERDLSSWTAQHNNIKGQMEQDNSTKKDLLGNLEAAKHEFAGERKSLEDEIKSLHARIEEQEDEIEHVGMSRANEQITYDERIHALEQELGRLAKEKEDKARKSDGQVEFLRKENRLQRECGAAHERDLQVAQDDVRALRKSLEAADESVEIQFRAMQELHKQLSPEIRIPKDVNDLAEGVTTRVVSVLSKVHDYQQENSLLQSDLSTSQTSLNQLLVELEKAKQTLSDEESVSMRLRENLANEKAKVTALEGELNEERSQLSQLRVKIADGETGLESLRIQLNERDRKIASLAEDLASRQSQAGSLEEEGRLLKDKLDESQRKLSRLSARSSSRTEQTRELTQRLYSHNDSLRQLLERLGFSVVREGDKMLIEKVPRSERLQLGNNNLDGSSSMRQSATLLNGRTTISSGDIELLNWMGSSDADEEAGKYKAFMNSLGTFDLDQISEKVYKRFKDIEHAARKLQRDAKSYRDKVSATQKDAHDKIAFRHFKEGDLALFLPTRNQTTGAWAAFNVGFPHYFLHEQEAHRLRNREWLVARISRIQERVVDLSKSLQQAPATLWPNKKDKERDAASIAETDTFNDENDNPFDLSDGLRWYLIEAHEDKPSAPSTPGLGKSTVAANIVEAMAEMRPHRREGVSRNSMLGSLGGGGIPTGIDGVSKTLSKSLESRRSSTASRKALPSALAGAASKAAKDGSPLASETNSLKAVQGLGDTPGPEGSSPQPVSSSGDAQNADVAAQSNANVNDAQGDGGGLDFPETETFGPDSHIL